MNLLLFFVTFNLILIARLKLTFSDEGVDRRTLIKMAVIPLLSLLLLEIGTEWFLLLGYLLASPVVMYLLERNGKSIYRKRLLILGLHAVVLAILFSPAMEPELAGYLQSVIASDSGISPHRMLMIQVYLFGGLLVMNEMNIVLRYLMKVLNLAPIGEEKNQDSISAQEYNTGRVIGMLERIFIYTFTLAGQFAAIGFVLTAKGVVRYREFEDRTFAEYVLIGTLLSALLAMGAAFLAQLFL